MKKPRFKKTNNKAFATKTMDDVFVLNKRMLFAVIVPMLFILVFSAFVLLGLVVARKTNLELEQNQLAPLTQMVYITPELAATPSLLPSATPSAVPSATPEQNAEEDDGNVYGRLNGTADGGANYMSRITFIGGDAANKLNLYYNSVTNDNVWYAPSNHGAILDKLTVDIGGEVILLPEAMGIIQPDILMFTFCGVNTGSRAWEADEFVDKYEALILALKVNASRDTQFVIMGLFPITDEYEKEDDYYKQSNARIAEINRGLEKFAYNNECFFLDVNGVLRGSDGALKEVYWSGSDHLLNRAGYSTVYNYIKTHQVLYYKRETE